MLVLALGAIPAVLWGTQPRSDAPAPAARDDVAAVRAAIAALQPQLVAPASTAPAPTANAATGDGDVDAARLRANVALTEAVYRARDVRRKQGTTGAALRLPFSLEELGGAAFETAMGSKAGARFVVDKNGAVLSPRGAQLPAGAAFAGDSAVLRTTAPGGVWLRYCPYAETLCVVDIASVPAVTPVATIALDTRALSVAVDALHAPAQVAAPARKPWTLALAMAAGALAVVVALRLRQLARDLDVVALHARAPLVKALAPPATPEARQLLQAMAHAGSTFASAAATDALHARRRERVVALAQHIHLCATGGDLRARIATDADDDAGLLALVDAANGLVETHEQRIARLRSHVQQLAVPSGTAPDVQRRIEALMPLPALFAEAATRLSRLATSASTPRAADELDTLASALGERAKTTRVLLDALALELATRPASPAAEALALLQAELHAVRASSDIMVVARSLSDLSPAQIAKRVAPSAV